jgi:co-chaperonin GroES (HSP10)
MRPEKTKGGIIRPDANKEEDVWQGKVGLVLKWGTAAFQDDAEYHFADADKVQVGEWAVYNVVDARSLMVNGFPCRLLRDASIMMKVDDPNSIF